MEEIFDAATFEAISRRLEDNRENGGGQSKSYPLTVNNLVATDSVLIPLQCEYYALEGVSDLLDTVHRIQRELNPSLVLEGVFLNMYTRGTQLSSMVVDEVRDYFTDVAYDTIVPRNVSIAEAPSFGRPVLLHAPWSKGAQSFTSLALELLSRRDRKN